MALVLDTGVSDITLCIPIWHEKAFRKTCRDIMDVIRHFTKCKGISPVRKYHMIFKTL